MWSQKTSWLGGQEARGNTPSTSSTLVWPKSTSTPRPKNTSPTGSTRVSPGRHATWALTHTLERVRDSCPTGRSFYLYVNSVEHLSSLLVTHRQLIGGKLPAGANWALTLLTFSVGLIINLFIKYIYFFFQNKAEGMTWRHWVICLCTSFEVASPGRA